jgi:hypothetical protein
VCVCVCVCVRVCIYKGVQLKSEPLTKP